MFTLETTTSPPLVALACLLVAGGVRSLLRREDPLRALGVGCLGVLIYNLALHLFWGDEFFLYSQHWLVPLAVILGGNLAWPGRAGRRFAYLYAVLTVTAAVHNAVLLEQIFATLAA